MKKGQEITHIGACSCTFIRENPKQPPPIFKADNKLEKGIAICYAPGMYEDVTIVDIQGKIVEPDNLRHFWFNLEEGTFLVEVPTDMRDKRS